MVKLLELAAYRDLQLRARVNDAAKALLLAHAQGSDLDQLAANVKLKRLVIRPADPQALPPTPEVKETDDALRERIQLAYEGLTTAGPRNSYILHARNASALVADAAAQSPSPACVTVTVLGLEGDGSVAPNYWRRWPPPSTTRTCGLWAIGSRYRAPRCCPTASMRCCT